MSEPILAWHFIKDDRTLNHDLRDTIVTVGLVLTTPKPIALCKRGFHASIKPLDALGYAIGSVICRVEMSGDIIHDDDKLVASERKVIAMADATNTLHEFAIWCAEQALNSEREAGREPDERSWQALEVKRKWLRGEAADDELGAAKDAAWAAVLAAARSAARSAAKDAARAAVWAAARSVAKHAARAAAWAAARSAEWAAARSVTRSAAWDAVCDVQNERLESMLNELLAAED